MEKEEEVRKVLKKFRCEKCGHFFKRLVSPHEDFTQCEDKDKCDWMAEEISDEIFKKLKEIKNRINNNTNNRENNSYNFSNSNNNNYSNQSNQYSNQNSNQNQQYSHNIPNLNNIFSSIPFFNNVSNNNTHSNINENTSSSQNQNIPFNGLSNVFSIFNTSFFNGQTPNLLRGRVIRINSNRSLFNPELFSFGSQFNDVFQDNYSSNFSSNFIDNAFRDDYLNNIIIYMQSMRNEERDHPTSKEAFEKMKKFKMNESYCKKDDNGKLEFPDCTVCLTGIEKDSDTLLIPCGHMFHESCIKAWLEKHNTCPVCRFELPTSN